MNKIIPILCLVASVVGAILALLALVFVSVCMATALLGLTVFAVPLLVVATVLVGCNLLFGFLFLKDRLCRISFLIAIVSLAMVLAGYAVLLLV